jgi:hypothetical protein
MIPQDDAVSVNASVGNGSDADHVLAFMPFSMWGRLSGDSLWEGMVGVQRGERGGLSAYERGV